MKNAWKKWIKITKKIMHIWANIFLFIIFFVLVVPFSYLIKFFSKDSLLGHNALAKKGSYWVKKEKVKYDINFAKLQ